MANELGIVFPILSDPDLSVIRRYGVEDEQNGIAWPAIFIVDRDGRVAWRSLTAIYKVRPASDVVLQALDRTLAR